MKPGSDKILARAGRALERADAHLAAGAPERALERAYYSIIHAARVVLNEAGERVRNHQKVAERLSQVPGTDLHQLRAAVDQALEWRSVGEEPTLDDSAKLLDRARLAVAEAHSYAAKF